MNLFGIDFTSFFQPLLALCGALALVLNARNQDISRLIRVGTEQVTRRENGKEIIDATRKMYLQKQAVIFRERILIVQQGLFLTYTAGICLTLMASFSKLPIPHHEIYTEVFGVMGILAVIVACASALRDILKSTYTTELELISAYGEEIMQHNSPLGDLFHPRKRGLWVRLAEGFHAFGKAFTESG